MKMWGGRFRVDADGSFMEFTSSIGFDPRLYPYDLRVTRAWTFCLEEAGLISPEELEAIEKALDLVGEEMDAGAFAFEPTDEDIHTAVERRLTELAGPIGGKVRTGRSRNDQIATDLRMFVMDAAEEISSGLAGLQGALIDKAEEYLDVVVPGHTHLQAAQPVLLAHLLLSFVYMLQRDRELVRTARKNAGVMPLGSAAFAGTTVPVNRDVLAERLGFTSVSPNSVDAVSDRDFACDLLFAGTMIMVHLSRLSEQIILWCSQEFGLAELDDAWSTGSSIMPQKKNPDGPELIRGKTGRVLGSLVGVATMLKGLPLAYNRDLQEDKEQLFDAVDTVSGSLHVMEGTVDTVSFDRVRARELTGLGYITATDLADYLVEKGMDFPQAHTVVGEVVSYCVDNNRSLDELSLEELTRFSDLFDRGALDRVTPEASVRRRAGDGGTDPDQAARKLREAREMVSGGRSSL